MTSDLTQQNQKRLVARLDLNTSDLRLYLDFSLLAWNDLKSSQSPEWGHICDYITNKTHNILLCVAQSWNLGIDLGLVGLEMGLGLGRVDCNLGPIGLDIGLNLEFIGSELGLELGIP